MYFEYGTWYSNVNQASGFRYNNFITCRSSITDSPMQSCSDNRYQSTETQHRSKSHTSVFGQPLLFFIPISWHVITLLFTYTVCNNRRLFLFALVVSGRIYDCANSNNSSKSVSWRNQNWANLFASVEVRN